jgi:ribosomal protein S18 acetylase RimI-like enzyme
MAMNFNHAGMSREMGASGMGGGDEKNWGFEVRKVPRELVRGALVRLIGPRTDRADLVQTVSQWLEGWEDPRVLDNMFGAFWPDGSLGQVGLLAPSSGKTASLYCSDASFPSGQVSESFGCVLRTGSASQQHAQRVGVLRATLSWTASTGVFDPMIGPLKMIQSLTNPEQVELCAALTEGGMSLLAELAYLRRELPRFAQLDLPNWPKGVEVVSVAELNKRQGENKTNELVMAGMDASYEGTLDCPELRDIRSLDETYESHRSVGSYDPSLWFVAFVDGAAQGCLLLNRYPEHDSIELVYLGLGRKARGRGLGKGLLMLAAHEVRRRNWRSLACAVDTRNVPAMKLYRAMRFGEFARRRAFVWKVG